jgi:hypothetical protein
MKTTTKLMLTLALTTTAGLALAFTASAYQGDPSTRGPDYSEERHEIMQKAFAENDFTAWQKEMQGRGRVTEVVTEENFPKFAEAHRLAAEGNLEAARELRAELGLGLKNGEGRQGKGRGQHRGGRQGNQDQTGFRAQAGNCFNE